METPVIVDSMVRHWVTVDDDAQTLKVIRKGLPVSTRKIMSVLIATITCTVL